MAERFAQMRQVLTGLIAQGARDFDLELALPAEQLAIAVDALADGIARQKLADPEAVPDELMGRVLSLLLTRLLARREAQGRPVEREQPPREWGGEAVKARSQGPLQPGRGTGGGSVAKNR